MSKGDNDREYAVAGMQYAIQAYQERYSAVSSEVNRLMQEMGAMHEVEAALQSKGIADKETLIHCGMGFYVAGRTGRADRIAVNIGGGLIAEKSVEEARQIASSRLEGMGSALKRLLAERKELEGAIYDLSYKLQNSVA